MDTAFSLKAVKWQELILPASFVCLAAPVLYTLLTTSWTDDSGPQSVLVLFTGGWLLSHKLPEMRKLRTFPNAAVLVAVVAASCMFYLLGQIADLITFAALGVFGVGVAIFYGYFGDRALKACWFPFFYLGFAIPPPNWVIDSATGPLKTITSELSVNFLKLFDLPIARSGVTIFVAQYQLLVEDACSGMNSIVGLTAITLLYTYLMHKSSARYAVLMLLLIVPIAIISNVVRVVLLILLTYFFGDGVAQGWLHNTTGLVVFATALLLLFAIDTLVLSVLRRTGLAK